MPFSPHLTPPSPPTRRHCRPAEIREAFRAFGTIRDVYIPLDNRTRRPRGFCFVEFDNEAEVQAAHDGMHKKLFGGRCVFQAFGGGSVAWSWWEMCTACAHVRKLV